MRILLAEDEAKVAAHVSQGLKADGYAVDIATDGEEAVWLAENYPYDLVLLDIMLPGRDGVMVLRHLRKKGLNVPVGNRPFVGAPTQDFRARRERRLLADSRSKPFSVTKVHRA